MHRELTLNRGQELENLRNKYQSVLNNLSELEKSVSTALLLASIIYDEMFNDFWERSRELSFVALGGEFSKVVARMRIARLL
jgi:hypothetical protein